MGQMVTEASRHTQTRPGVLSHSLVPGTVLGGRDILRQCRKDSLCPFMPCSTVVVHSVILGQQWHVTWVLTGSVETKGVPLFYAEIAGDSCLLNLQPLLLSVSSVHRRWGPGFQQQQGRLCPLPLSCNAGYRPLRALVLT